VIPRILLALGAALALSNTAQAHVFEVTDVAAELTPESYTVDLTVDVDALALGVSPQTDSAEVAAALLAMTPAELDRARQRAMDTLSRRTRVRIDDVKQRPEISFPEGGPEAAEQLGIPSVLGVTARLRGSIPANSVEIRFGLSRSFGEARLVVRWAGTTDETIHLLAVGGDSPDFSLTAPPRPPSAAATTGRYLHLGILHIVPRGTDHMLFVLGLFLMTQGLRDLLIRISAFTVAHTMTLGMSAAGWVVVPGGWVEPLIALSIAWIALENLRSKDWNAWRTAVVFGFGMLHGLGFAGVLGELGLPDGQFFPALLGFNVGVEIGQLSVVLVAWILLHRFREHAAYRPRVVVPVSFLIGAIGLWWAIERTFL
jgi:hypothetical protein